MLVPGNGAHFLALLDLDGSSILVSDDMNRGLVVLGEPSSFSAIRAKHRPWPG